MTEAKVPDNKSDWKSIDIFIFSNGQRLSPPRKYHLVTDQLDWWKATLNFLAQSQYGSLHSNIELYTIEGTKIETPMQLSHNTAYVAVAPPDLFIDASYEKYLIKATRSWEKGQFRRCSKTAVVGPEEIHTKNDKSNNDFQALESPNTKVPRDGSFALKTIVASVVDNQASALIKPEDASDRHINNTDNLNPVKLSSKTHRPSIVRTPGTMKKSSLPSPPQTRKPSPKQKDSVRINMETTKDRFSPESNKILTRSKISKPIHKPRDSLPKIILEEVINEATSSSSLKLVNVNRSLTKASDVKSVEDDEISIMSKCYINTCTEKPSIAVNPDIDLSKVVDRQSGTRELFDECHHFKSIDCEKVENIVESNTAISLNLKNMTNNPTIMEHELSLPVVSKVSKPKNSVSQISKEGTVNLKLNIEIWNYPNDAKNTAITEPDKESLIFLKRDKVSQIDIEEKSLKHDITIASGIRCVKDEGNHKVIIVKCACLNQDGDKTKNSLIPVNIGNSNFLICLPVSKLDEDCKRCNCKENKEINISSHNLSADYPVKKTTSCLSLYNGREEKIVSRTEQTVESNIIHDKNEMTTIKRKSVAIREDQESFSQLQNASAPMIEPVKECTNVLVHHVEPEKTECTVLKKESTGILHKSANKFTQTEWCDVLLEVKLRNDGQYSLHLPPLEMLKNYKL